MEGTLAQRGAKLFNDLACNTCHLDTGQGRGPSLKDIVGKPVELQDGATVIVDEAYLRESILNSQAKIVKGFQPLMPTFQGLVSEDNLVALIEYVKSLSPNATTAAAPAAAAAPRTPRRSGVRRSKPCWTRSRLPERHYLNNGHGLASWLLTKDHKRIAILYLISISVMFFLGGLFAVGIRLELATPQGDFVTRRHLQQVLHHARRDHGVLLPDPVDSGGARQLPDPADDRREGPGVPAHQPAQLVHLLDRRRLHALRDGHRRRRHRLDLLHAVQHDRRRTPTSCRPALGVFIAGFSSILTGLNFIVTIHRMRAPGMTWFRLPLFVWAHYATSLIQVLGTPVIAITIVMLVRRARPSASASSTRRCGGDPVLFQHLFWFYSHPAVYIMILPAMGVISELISTFSRKTIFGYSFVAFSSLAIAVFGFLVWAHHMFVAGISTYAAMVFSFLSFSVAIPSAVKVFNWTATLYKGSISFETPMLYAYGFIGLFLIGGLTGLFLATLGIDIHLHDTYFVVAHFHYIMVGGAIMGYLGGLHFWWPKMTGRMYSEFCSRSRGASWSSSAST